MFLVKGLAFALAPSIPLLFAAILLQAPSFALYTCAVVLYVSAVIAPENGAKAQSLAFSMTTLGAVGASLVGGWLFDHCSVRTTLLIAAAVCAAGVAVCVPTVKRTGRS
jgi:PPP family 3-phenylpropionic acid transporter